MLSDPELRNPNLSIDDAQVKDRPLIFEQYKLFVQMADETSKRRLTSNSYFWTLHSVLYVALWAFLAKDIKAATSAPGLLLLLPFGILAVICVIWWYSVRSYDQLNGAKHTLVGEMESWLPLRPWTCEWKRLGGGADPSRYMPLSRLERWIPVVMGVCDVLTIAVVLWIT